MGATGEDAAGVPAEGTSGITKLPGGYLQSTHGITPELIRQGFEEAQKRREKSEGAPPPPEEKLTDETNPPKPTGIELAQEQPSIQGEAGLTTESTSTKPAAPVEEKQHVEPSDSDLESMLETERQRKTQEARKAWVDLMNTMKENPVPFFTASASKKMLVLIKPTHDPSNPNSETYIVITENGPKAIQATKEARGMINKLYLNPTEDPTVNTLETLEMTPLSISDATDLVSSVITESQGMAAKIGKINEECGNLEASKELANKLTDTIKPQQVSPDMPKASL